MTIRATRPAGTTWDSSSSRPRFQGVLLTIAGLALLPAAIATIMRVLPPTDDAAAQLAAFIPYGLIGYLLALCCLLVALVRARGPLVLAVITVAVAALTTLHLAWLAPLFVRDHRVAQTAEFQLMSLNMLHGAADPQEVAERAARADIVILVEATPPALAALKPFGWDERFPYSVGDPKDGFFNTAVYARFPLSHPTLISGFAFQQWVMTVAVPDVGSIRLMAVHPCNPYCGDRWHAEHLMLREIVMDNLDQPLVLAGDFNAVDDHGPMQALRRVGLKSATDVAGAGWLPTYPADGPLPPLLPIDHVMINKGLTATSVTSFAISGTDHLGVFATLAGTN
ncbi:MAG TPA: endonuclease/exonuclease/phosphatase family protein [Propionibacteriaceae bacterium]|nr:endonuclease/exonuclease/phosphatase family protein [Propionibacteriaceae bacterium]